ncbi:MAG: hypothetical protein ACE145_06230 [Terriglobia bacterium]
MSLLCLAVIAAIGIWFHYGNTGLGTAVTVATMIAAGVGVESFLNTFWKGKGRTTKGLPEVRFWQPRRINILSRALSRNAERRASAAPSFQEVPDLAPVFSRKRRGLAAEES